MSHDRPARRIAAALPRPARTLGLLVLLAAVLTAAAPGVIRIKRGDTLSELARQHHTTVAVLQALNHMGGSTTIYAGDTLVVPGEAAPAPAARPVTRTTVGIYVVRPGDGLIRVARAYRTTPQRLQQLNGLRRTTLLVGQHLKVPVTVTVARPVAPATAGGGTLVVPGSVASSAAAHRALLASRTLPSKATVQSLIRKAAKKYGVPTDLALALSYQESGFQQRVVSPVDAIGALQVLPSTGRSLGRLHGRSFDLLDASDNVEAGVLLISDLLRVTGSVDRALAGYYQGLGSVGRVGLLPQTKQYVRNVGLLRQRFR